MNLCKGANYKWFVAAKENDVAYLQQNMNSEAGKTDPRETKENDGVFGGFSALCYACAFGSVQAAQLLMQTEILVPTEQNVVIPSIGISQFARYKLGSGATCLSIALLRKQKRIVMFLLQYLQSQPNVANKLIGQLTSLAQSTYLVASVCKYAEAYEVLKSPLFIREFPLLKRGDCTPVFTAALFGRYEALQIYESFEKIDTLREDLYEMLLQRDDDGYSAMELAREGLDLQTQYNCTDWEKAQIQLLLQRLTRRAFVYATFSGWINLTQEFLKGRAIETVFGAQAAERIQKELLFFTNEVDRRDASWRQKLLQSYYDKADE